jgi:hypothetical protein
MSFQVAVRASKQLVTSDASTVFYTCSCNNSEELYIVHHGTWSAVDKQVTLPFDLNKHLDVQQHLDGRP